MHIHFSEEELAVRRRAAVAELADRGLDGLLDVPPGVDVLPHRLRHLRLRLLPVPVHGSRRPVHDPAHPYPRPPAGEAHLRDRGHKAVVRRGGRQPRRGPEGDSGRARLPRQAARHRDRRLRPDRLQPQARGGRPRRLLRAGRGLRPGHQAARGQIAGRNRVRPGGGAAGRPGARRARSRWRRRASSRGTSWRRCRARSSRGVATSRRTRSSSAPGRGRCCSARRRGCAAWTRWTSSPWSGPAPTATTTPP